MEDIITNPRQPTTAEKEALIAYFLQCAQPGQPGRIRRNMRWRFGTPTPSKTAIVQGLKPASFEVYEDCRLYRVEIDSDPYEGLYLKDGYNGETCVDKIITVIWNAEAGPIEPGEPDAMFVWHQHTFIWECCQLFLFTEVPNHFDGYRVHLVSEQFEKWRYRKPSQYIHFNSPEGRVLFEAWLRQNVEGFLGTVLFYLKRKVPIDPYYVARARTLVEAYKREDRR